MTHLATAALLAISASCVTSEPAPDFERPAGLLDLGSLSLDTPFVRAPDTTASLLEQIRLALDRVRTQIGGCIADTRDIGAIDFALTLAVDPARGAMVESVDVAFDSQGHDPITEEVANVCVHDALLAFDTFSIAPPDAAARWVVHASLYTGAP